MKCHKSRVVTCIGALLIILSAYHLCVAQRRFVSIRGKVLITPSGEPLFVKGINLGNWLMPEGYMFKFKHATSPRLIHAVINELVGEDEAKRFWRAYHDNYITAEDIKFISDAGFNTIRVPFNYRLFVINDDPARLEGIGYELLDRVINWARKENLYVVLDMHAAPGGQTGDNIDDSWGYPFLFDSAESQELTVRIWQKIATRYANEPVVLGYDLLNEPIAHFFDTVQLNPKLEPLYRKIVTAIRQVDKNHIIFLGGAQWNTNFKVFGPPFDDKLVYTFHKYWMDVKQEAIQEYLDFSNKYDVPIWMGESGENSDEWVASFRTLLERNGVGWCFWTYKRLDATACVASIKKPANWDAIITFADHPRTTFADIRTNRPTKETVQRALRDYLEEVKFQNCKINRSYLTALGLR